jgi:peptidoglycan/LPS O-acetylase OafA/YrhL
MTPIRGSTYRQGTQAKTRPDRVVALDGLRGPAALVVVLGDGMGAIYQEHDPVARLSHRFIDDRAPG